MQRSRMFKQVDVFTSVALLGNPVAVVLDSAGLLTEQMQAIANWTNLSETTFVSAPDDPTADYAVRIFTPRSELPFAGHPTLGTAHAVIEAGLASPTGGRLIQKCAVGLVTLTIKDQALSFELPRYRVLALEDEAALLQTIGYHEGLPKSPMIVDVGPHWIIAELPSAHAVNALLVDLPALAAYNQITATTGLTVFAADRAETITVRSFAPGDGLIEDPVCGSGNGAVAAFRLYHRDITDGSAYVARQGSQMGRNGFVDVRIDGAAIHIGGNCVTCVDGILRC